MPLAGFGDRLVAYLIDAAVFFGVALVLAVPAMFAIFALLGAQIAGLETDPETGQLIGEPNVALFLGPVLLVELAVILLTLVASYLYHVELFPSRRAITLGKRAMKLRVIRLDDPSAPITRGIAARRWAMQFLVGGIVPLFSWADGLWQLWDKPYQQCLHDKVAETIVVKVST
jgi:uncharacterized RDD family membrane protein YckC